MADLDGGQRRCLLCGAEWRSGDAFCPVCSAGGSGPQRSMEPGSVEPGSAGSPLASVGDRGPESVAQAWGWVSIGFGVLVLVGLVVPWFSGSSFALTDDMGSAWPLVALGLVGVLGGVDGLRGSLLGPALAAGVGSVFVLLQVVMVRLLTLAPGVKMGGGGVAWTVAAIAAVPLVVGVLSAV